MLKSYVEVWYTHSFIYSTDKTGVTLVELALRGHLLWPLT